MAEWSAANPNAFQNIGIPNTDTNGDGIPDTYVASNNTGFGGTGSGLSQAPIDLEINLPDRPRLATNNA